MKIHMKGSFLDWFVGLVLPVQGILVCRIRGQKGIIHDQFFRRNFQNDNRCTGPKNIIRVRYTVIDTEWAEAHFCFGQTGILQAESVCFRLDFVANKLYAL